MNDSREKDKNTLSFSQREGKEALPDAMKLEHVPRRFRASIWRAIYTSIRHDTALYSRDEYESNSKIMRYISEYQEHILEIYFDDVKRTPSSQSALMKPIVTEGEYHEVLTLVEYLLRVALKRNDQAFHNGLSRTFEQTPVAYFVDNPTEWPTIYPTQDKISGEVIASALVDIRDGGQAGAQQHLSKAARAINEGRYEDSIVQSVHSIESVARLIAPEDCKTLGPALDSLERNKILHHRALKDAFSKLYGYTNDKQGLRHPILEDASNPPDLDEAVFFFGACACFAAYLIKKSRQISDK